MFILVGLAFKVSAVPFHMWTPDVYEGAPTSITSFFAAVPKVAGLALLIKFMLIPFAEILLRMANNNNFYFNSLNAAWSSCSYCTKEH